MILNINIFNYEIKSHNYELNSQNYKVIKQNWDFDDLDFSYDYNYLPYKQMVDDSYCQTTFTTFLELGNPAQAFSNFPFCVPHKKESQIHLKQQKGESVITEFLFLG